MNYKDIEKEFDFDYIYELKRVKNAELSTQDFVECGLELKSLFRTFLRKAMESVVVEESNLNTEAQSGNEIFNKIKERLIGYNQARQETLNNIDKFFN